MKTLIVTAICLFSLTCFGQTKLISFRSHSGNIGNFRTTVEGNLFDIGNSNFGLRHEIIYKVDEVVLKSSNEIVLKTMMFSRIMFSQSRYKVESATKIITKENAPGFFRATSIDSLKAEIQKIYGVFETVKLDSTKFIGFDKQFKQKKVSQRK